MGERRWYRICWCLVLLFTGEAWIVKPFSFQSVKKTNANLAVDDAVSFPGQWHTSEAESLQPTWGKVASHTIMQEEASSLLAPITFNISGLGISLANVSLGSMGSGADPHLWLHDLLSRQPDNNPDEAIDSDTVDKLVTSFGFTILSSPLSETLGHEVASFLSGLARLGVPWSAMATQRLLCVLIEQAIVSAFPNELSVIIHSLGELGVNQMQDLPSTLTESLLNRLSTALTDTSPRVFSRTLWGLKECRFHWKQYVTVVVIILVCVFVGVRLRCLVRCRVML